jgi:hypothetical protein
MGRLGGRCVSQETRRRKNTELHRAHTNTPLLEMLAVPKQEKTLNRELHVVTLHPGHNGDKGELQRAFTCNKLCCWCYVQQLPLYCLLMHTKQEQVIDQSLG